MVSCSLPSARLTVPTAAASTPSSFTAFASAAEATTTGGHCVAQEPLQLDFDGFGLSLSKRYSVNPVPSTTTVPRSAVGLAVSAGPAGAVGAGAAAGAATGAGEGTPVTVLLVPHAPSETAAAAASATRGSTRVRIMTVLRGGGRA